VLQSGVIAELDAGYEVELDLAPVPFVDSSGLGALVQITSHARERGIAFTLVAPLPAQMRRVLDVTGLGEHLPIASVPTVP
jgi:anti-sigma B factor antagonist